MNKTIHTIPIGDKELHFAQSTCWCHPTEIEPSIAVHNAADCRESQERITGCKSSEGWVLIAERPDRSDRDWEAHLRIQLAAEVEKVNKLQQQLTAERESRVKLTELATRFERELKEEREISAELAEQVHRAKALK